MFLEEWRKSAKGWIAFGVVFNREDAANGIEACDVDMLGLRGIRRRICVLDRGRLVVVVGLCRQSDVDCKAVVFSCRNQMLALLLLSCV